MGNKVNQSDVPKDEIAISQMKRSQHKNSQGLSENNEVINLSSQENQMHQMLQEEPRNSKSLQISQKSQELIREIETLILEKNQNQSHAFNINNYDVVSKIGNSIEGRILLIKHIKNKHKQFAIKVVKKSDLGKLEQSHIQRIYRQIQLQGISHENLVKVVHSFQNKSKIYIVTEYCANGDLDKYIQQIGKLDEDAARFVVAQVVLAIKYIQQELNMIYRNLMAQNVMISSNGYIKLGGFGLCDLSTRLTGENNFSPAHAHMQPPEILSGQDYTKSSDQWGLGIFLYYLLHADYPFASDSKNVEKMKQNMLHGAFPIDKGLSEEAKDLIKKLLVPDPIGRLGSQNFNKIFQHPFFSTLNWEQLKQQRIPSPLFEVFQKVQHLQKIIIPKEEYQTPVQYGILQNKDIQEMLD